MTKSFPKVTVIIPCYNRESYVGKTIESALNQSYPNIEVIAVDDCSTDSTYEVLKSFGGRIRVMRQTENRGQSAAINMALRLSDGEFVAILDSDDIWDQEKIAFQVDYIAKHPEVGLIYVNGYSMDEDGTIQYKLYRPGHKEENRPELLLLDCYIFLPSCSLVRRSAFDTAGIFDETMRSAQDHDMALRLAEVTRFAYVDRPLWYYRKHGDTQSSRYSARRWQTGFRILEKACERRDYSSVRKRRLAVLNFRMGQAFLQSRNTAKALLFFTKAVLLDPVRASKVFFRIERIS